MPRRFVVAGSTGIALNVFLQDRSSGDGVITMTTDKVKAQYQVGTTGPVTTIALVGEVSTVVWASGGWGERSSTLMPGVYRLDVPDASITTPDVTYFIHCSTPGQNFLPVAVNLQVISSGGSDLPSDVILYKGMAQTSVNIGTMLTSVNSKVTSVDSRLSSMDTMLSSVNSKVTSVDSRLSSMDTMLTSVNAKVTSVDTKVTSINTVLTSVNTVLTSVNAKVTSIDSRLSSMDTMLTSVNAQVTSIDSRLTSMDTMLTSVNSHATSADTVANSVLTKVTSIDSRLTSMDTMLTSVNAKVTSVDTKVMSTSATHLNLIADAILDRDMSVGVDSGSSSFRTARQSLRFLRNKWAIAGTTLTVYKEDDTAASWTAELTTNASADPISAVDPA
jgi:peptidoglycan hydrolase CwlO-like protein